MISTGTATTLLSLLLLRLPPLLQLLLPLSPIVANAVQLPFTIKTGQKSNRQILLRGKLFTSLLAAATATQNMNSTKVESE